MTKTDDQLEAEASQLSAKLARLEVQARDLRGRRQAIQDELRIRRKRRELEPLIDVPDAVRVTWFGYVGGGREGRLIGVLGTIKVIRRTRAIVDYGDLGSWNIPLAELAPAAAGDRP
jgi:hypothetical protein